jgi:hypothetical protein
MRSTANDGTSENIAPVVVRVDSKQEGCSVGRKSNVVLLTVLVDGVNPQRFHSVMWQII